MKHWHTDIDFSNKFCINGVILYCSVFEYKTLVWLFKSFQQTRRNSVKCGAVEQYAQK